MSLKVKHNLYSIYVLYNLHFELGSGTQVSTQVQLHLFMTLAKGQRSKVKGQRSSGNKQLNGTKKSATTSKYESEVGKTNCNLSRSINKIF